MVGVIRVGRGELESRSQIDKGFTVHRTVMDGLSNKERTLPLAPKTPCNRTFSFDHPRLGVSKERPRLLTRQEDPYSPTL